MNTVKIEIQSNGLNDGQATLLGQFLVSLQNQAPEQVVNEGKEVQPEVAQPLEAPKATTKKAKKETTKSEPIPAGEAIVDEAPTQEEINEIEVNEPEEVDRKEEAKPSVTLQDIRSLVFIKKDAHKEDMRAKLKEFGAESIPTLDPSKFQAFFDFLISLD